MKTLASWPKDNTWLIYDAPNSSFILRNHTNDGETPATGRALTCGDFDDQRKIDGNYLISFARAAWAAGQLNSRGGEKLKINKIQSISSDYALTGNSALDRRIQIKLIPR